MHTHTSLLAEGHVDEVVIPVVVLPLELQLVSVQRREVLLGLLRRGGTQTLRVHHARTAPQQRLGTRGTKPIGSGCQSGVSDAHLGVVWESSAMSTYSSGHSSAASLGGGYCRVLARASFSA